MLLATTSSHQHSGRMAKETVNSELEKSWEIILWAIVVDVGLGQVYVVFWDFGFCHFWKKLQINLNPAHGRLTVVKKCGLRPCSLNDVNNWVSFLLAPTSFHIPCKRNGPTGAPSVLVAGRWVRGKVRRWLLYLHFLLQVFHKHSLTLSFVSNMRQPLGQGRVRTWFKYSNKWNY